MAALWWCHSLLNRKSLSSRNTLFGNTAVARQSVRVDVFSACLAARQPPATQYRWINGREHTKANVMALCDFLCDFMHLSCAHRFNMYSLNSVAHDGVVVAVW